jgi:L-lactate dehydrogenase (cytochrome)
MKQEMNYKYPSVDDLRLRAKAKIPKFAFEYLDGGCNNDVNLKKIQNAFEL